MTYFIFTYQDITRVGAIESGTTKKEIQQTIYEKRNIKIPPKDIVIITKEEYERFLPLWKG